MKFLALAAALLPLAAAVSLPGGAELDAMETIGDRVSRSLMARSDVPGLHCGYRRAIRKFTCSDPDSQH